ncbi:hypothetical protein DFO56_10851 [Kosakonia sp. AG348]|nr:hypothetical protein DFO56_10851 [Kosakonia sp. AG348]
MRNSSKVYTIKLIFKRIGILIKYILTIDKYQPAKKAHLAVL